MFITKTYLVKLLRVEYKTLDIGEETSPRKNLEEGTSSSGKKENLEEGISSSGVKVLVWIHQAGIKVRRENATLGVECPPPQPQLVRSRSRLRRRCSELADGCQKISGVNKLLSSSPSVACQSNLPEWPALSISRSSRFRFHQHLHCWSSKGH
uniref:Uncharacterized protein n=1 Tax=Salix viminalis TaxID=40686 RepID=A0A6N2LVA2_SALVM